MFITCLRGYDSANLDLPFKFRVICEQSQNLKTPFFCGPVCYRRINDHKLIMNWVITAIFSVEHS